MLNNINNYILLILINTMGRGAHAAHAAYNGSGTQGISVTNEINENKDTHSVFITQNDTSKQILHGHNISEMTCSGKTENITSETYKIFTPNENVDMLGDIYLNFEMDSEISTFEFNDASQSVNYNLFGYTQDDLTTSFTAGGIELRSMELDLTTNEEPSTTKQINLNMKTVNQVKTFKYESNLVQIAAGIGTTNNVAYRYSGSTDPNEFGDWNYINIPDLVEIYDFIYDPSFRENSDSPGSVIFGGHVKRDKWGVSSGLYFLKISDLADPNGAEELCIRKTGIAQAQTDPAIDSNLLTHYITVNKLNYLPETGFISSGRKYFEEGEMVVVTAAATNEQIPIIKTQTSNIFRNNSSNYYTYNTEDLPFELTLQTVQTTDNFSSNPEVTSSLNIPESGDTVLSCGSRYNTMLALDDSGLIIKSYDNGNTWDYAKFYYGAVKSSQRYEEGGEIYGVDLVPGTGYGPDYSDQDEVLFLQDNAINGRGRVGVSLVNNYPQITSLSVTEGGYGYKNYQNINDVKILTRGTQQTFSFNNLVDPNRQAEANVYLQGSLKAVLPTLIVDGAGGQYSTDMRVQLKIERNGALLSTDNYEVAEGYISTNQSAAITGWVIDKGGSGYRVGDIVLFTNDSVTTQIARGTVGDIGFNRPSPAYDPITKLPKTDANNESIDKDVYISNKDPGFEYFMPRVSQLHTNNLGVWTAIGQQGLQLDSISGSQRYRQFVFVSQDDGETWHPVRLNTFLNKNEIHHVQYDSLHVDYISIYSGQIENCKILMSVPDLCPFTSVFINDVIESNLSNVDSTTDLNVINTDPIIGKSNVLFNIRYDIQLPLIPQSGSVNRNSNRLVTNHRITPWIDNQYGSIMDKNSGLYRLTNIHEGFDVNINHLREVSYEFLGALTNGKNDILFGKVDKYMTTLDASNSHYEIGIIVILSSGGKPSDQGDDDMTTGENTRQPIDTIVVHLGKNRIIQKMTATRLGMFAIISAKDGVNDEHQLIASYDGGINWNTIKVINILAYNRLFPLFIESDTYGNIVYAYKENNANYYEIFKITYRGEDSEINVLQEVFTDITSLQYVGTEWIITGTIDVNSVVSNVIVKSYDLIKWRKPNINSQFPNISSIVVKEKRLYENLFKLPDTGQDAEPFEKSNYRVYEVCHSDYRSVGRGLGVRAYKIDGFDFSSGRQSYISEYKRSLSVKITNTYGGGQILTYSTPVANDVFQLGDGSIILCGENKEVHKDGDYYSIRPAVDYRYVTLAEGPGPDGLTFNEAQTIYSESPDGAISYFTKSFDSLHKVEFLDSNSVLAIGRNWYKNDFYGYDLTNSITDDLNINESQTIEGVLALRHFPDPVDYPNVPLGQYRWKFIFGPTGKAGVPPIPFPSFMPTPFEKINDVYTNNLRETVVVGKPKSGGFSIYYEMPDISFKTFRDDWKQIPLNYHGLSEVLSVCYTGSRWVFVGIPTPKWVDVNGNEVAAGYPGASNVNDGKILAHTTDLLDPDSWVIENFSFPNLPHPFDINPGVDSTTRTFEKIKSNFTNINSWQGNHVRPVNYNGISGVIINASFYDWDSVANATASDPARPWDALQEKVYFMYDNDGVITIRQNDSFPEPKLLYREILQRAPPLLPHPEYRTDQHGGEQFRPTWETYVNGTLRTLFTTVYPQKFNQYIVDLDADGFFYLKQYSNPTIKDVFSEFGSAWWRRYRKFITTNTTSLRNKMDGNCYKVEQVKNENFITGVDSAKYIAVGKGIKSPMLHSRDLINWYDVNIKDIFTVVFDIHHKGGIWVAIGEGNYNLAISKDGKSWKGIYTRYQSNTLSLDYSTAFNSLDYYNGRDNNVMDVLPYVPNLKGIFLRNLSLLRLFSKIEYHVGTQIWQTLTFDDVKAMLDTEFGSGEYKKLSKNCSIINKNGSTRFTTWIPGFTKTLNSKLETFTNVSENGSFPSGLLKDQKLSIKIYYNKLDNILGQELTSSDMNNNSFDNLIKNTLIPTDRNTNYYVDSFLADNYGFQLGDTYRNVNGHFVLNYKTEIKNFRLYSKNFELDDIEINEFNKGVKQVPKITQSLYFDANNTSNLILDLDSFDLYASHIIVSGWLTSEVYIKNMDLELNGYSYQKTIDPSIIDFSTKSYLGLNYNKFIFNGIDKEDGIGSLIIPLASTAYSGSSVPLDRYNSIRLRIIFNTIAGPYSYINVTCVGTTTVSYNNSTANIDLY